jgi:hypothetical protein
MDILSAMKLCQSTCRTNLSYEPEYKATTYFSDEKIRKKK